VFRCAGRARKWAAQCQRKNHASEQFAIPRPGFFEDGHLLSNQLTVCTTSFSYVLLSRAVPHTET
jgi:hypothetical protein